MRHMSHKVAISVALLLATASLQAGRADLSGRVVFNGIGVPGASVTIAKGTRTEATLSGDDGTFRFATVEDGAWTMRVEMRGFVTHTRDVAVPLSGEPLTIAMAMQPLDAILASAAAEPAPAAVPNAAATSEPPPDETAIINGSVINGAATPFAQPRAFGNNRPQLRPAYSGAVNVLGGNSALNARPYSFGTSSAPPPSYSDVHIGGVLAGPMKIPWLITNGPQTTVSYQHAVNHQAITQSALMPTDAERRGDFSESAVTLRDPLTGAPFPGNVLPPERISSQAASLLAYYPAERRDQHRRELPAAGADDDDRRSRAGGRAEAAEPPRHADRRAFVSARGNDGESACSASRTRRYARRSRPRRAGRIASRRVWRRASATSSRARWRRRRRSSPTVSTSPATRASPATTRIRRTGDRRCCRFRTSPIFATRLRPGDHSSARRRRRAAEQSRQTQPHGGWRRPLDRRGRPRRNKTLAAVCHLPAPPPALRSAISCSGFRRPHRSPSATPASACAACRMTPTSTTTGA